jgi:hypothetical protein
LSIYHPTPNRTRDFLLICGDNEPK